MLKLYKNKSEYSTKNNFELELQYAKKIGFDINLSTIRIASKKKSNPNNSPWGFVDETSRYWVMITPSFLGIEQKIKEKIKFKHGYTSNRARTLGKMLCDHTRKKYCEKEYEPDTLAINQCVDTHTLYIDIDKDREGLYIANLIRTKLDLEEIITEINYANGRVHIIFPTDRSYSDKELKYIRDKLRQEFNQSMDIRLSTTVMRYIDSIDYTTGMIKNNQFIPFSSPEERISYGLNFKTEKIFSLQKLYNLTKKEYTEQRYIPQETSLPKSISMIEGRLNSETNKILYRNIFDESYLDKWVYGYGTRYEFTGKIISNCLRMGITDTEEICKIVMSRHDGTSRDINSMGKENYVQSKLIPMIEDFKSKYDESIPYRKPSKKEIVEFISNIHLLDLENNKKFDRHIRSILLELKKPISKIYTKHKRYEEAIRVLPFLLKEILGYSVYSDKNPRVKNNQLRISDYKFEQLMYGFQMSNDLLKKFCKHYKVTGINIRNLFDLVMEELFIQIKSNNRGWSFSDSNEIPKSCKQFIIKSPIFYSDNESIKDNLTKCNKKPLKHTNELLLNSLLEYHNNKDINNIYIHKDIYKYNTLIDFTYYNIEYYNINIIYKNLFSGNKERDVDD